MLFKNNIEQIITIEGMHCEHCAKRVSDALLSIKNIKKVNVDLENKTATIIVKQKVDNEVLKTTINNLGFEFVDAK